MTEQSEAQRLADCLTRGDSGYSRQAAAELRRLEAVNAQLLEALLEYKRLYEEVQPAGGWQGVYETGNAAIAAAKGQA